MCLICYEFAPEAHWSDALAPGAVAEAQPRRVRHRRLSAVKSVLGPYGLTVSDPGAGRHLVVSDRKGTSVVASDLPALWRAAQSLSPRAIDVLDPGPLGAGPVDLTDKPMNTMLSQSARNSQATWIPGSARRDVTLLSGFLGSGKTTLLRAELARAGADAPSVILNDFADTPVDDLLLTNASGHPSVIVGGCACCTRRHALAIALRALLDVEQSGDRATRRSVVIETSGLSDPGPIAFTLATDPVLRHHYALARVCVTVDAIAGLRTLERHEVAVRQLMAADQVLVTKADLVNQADVHRLVVRLQELNPSAEVAVTARGNLKRRVPPLSSAQAKPAVAQDRVEHARDVATLELVTDRPLDWQAFSVWLTALLHVHGPDILRVKGVLDVDEAGAVAINGVQHIVHQPEHLAQPVQPGTRLVFIVQGIDPGSLERSFQRFVGPTESKRTQ